MGKLFWESNYIDGSHISQFLAHFMAFSIFRTPYLAKKVIFTKPRSPPPPQPSPHHLPSPTTTLPEFYGVDIQARVSKKGIYLTFFEPKQKQHFFPKGSRNVFFITQSLLYIGRQNLGTWSQLGVFQVMLKSTRHTVGQHYSATLIFIQS